MQESFVIADEGDPYTCAVIEDTQSAVPSISEELLCLVRLVTSGTHRLFRVSSCSSTRLMDVARRKLEWRDIWFLAHLCRLHKASRKRHMAGLLKIGIKQRRLKHFVAYMMSK